MRLSSHTDDSHNCVVPGCKSRSGAGSSTLFFPVPVKANKVFKKWCAFMVLRGKRREKICKNHFRDSDLITYSSRKVKETVVPSQNLPQSPPFIKQDGYCCISTCRMKIIKTLLPFPPLSKQRQHKQWKKALQMTKTDSSAGLRICPRHFEQDDFVTVKSFYLRPHAVPSCQVKRLVKCPRRHIRNLQDVPGHLRDHTYFENWFKARSNRICSVVGCSLRAGNNVHLHSFPKEKDRFKQWMMILRCGKYPSLNAKVCNNHFVTSDYVPESKRLKKSAIPSQNLPRAAELDISINEYITPRQSFRKKKISLCLADDETTSTSSVSSRNAADARVSLDTASIDELSNSLNKTNISDVNDPQINQSTFSLIETVDTNINNNVSTKCPTCLQNNTAQVQCTVMDVTRRDPILSDMLLTDEALNTWTGIPKTEMLQEICLATKKLESSLYPRKFTMNCADRVILVMVKLKQNISFAAIGILFRIHAATVANYFSHTVQILNNVLQAFVYMPSKEEIRLNIPQCFRGRFSNVTLILDCTEVPLGTLKCLNCRISTYSHYKSRRTVKFLIGVTPAGLISYRSRAYSGKSSDKYIFNAEKLIDQLTPHIDEVMVDKGFLIENELSTKGIKLHRPPFMKNNRLSPSEAYMNEAIAKARVHVERIMQRIKTFEIFQDTFDVCMLGYINEIMTIICGLVNLTNPILRDDKF